jgi:hypothetical protein
VASVIESPNASIERASAVAINVEGVEKVSGCGAERERGLVFAFALGTGTVM